MAPDLKRKRTNTAGDDDDSSKQPKQPKQQPNSLSVTKPESSLPAAWVNEILSLAHDAKHPPKTVIKRFLELYVQSSKDFRCAQETLQRAMAAERKFEADASMSAPTYITQHLKGPPFVLPKLILEEGTESLTTARTELDKALLTVHEEAVKYFRTCHSTSVSLCKGKIDIAACTRSLQEELTTYATEVILATGVQNTQIWNAYIAAVANAFTKDLESASFEFTASVMYAASNKDAKDAAVAAARHDAELAEATKPIGKLIEEKLDDTLEARVDALGMYNHILPPCETIYPHRSTCSSRKEIEQDHRARDKEGQTEPETQGPAEHLEGYCTCGIIEDCEKGQKEGKRKGKEHRKHRRRGRGKQRKGQGDGEKESENTHRGEAKKKTEANYILENRGSGRHRVILKADPNRVTTWVGPTNQLHHHRSSTYPVEFFTAPESLRSRYILLNMSELYFDMRITNRALHNMTDIKLTPDQAKILSLNSKFVPRPTLTHPSTTEEAFEDFTRRLRLRRPNEEKDIVGKTQTTLCQYLGLPEQPKAQPEYVAKFHIPKPEAIGKPLALEVEQVLNKTRDQLQIEVLSRQAISIRPNISANDLKDLLGLLKDNQILAVPADKNLGLCLVTLEWYMETGLKLLQNASYTEEEPDHDKLQLVYREVISNGRSFLTKQQHTWLKQPLVEERVKVPTLKVIPKIHKLPLSAQPIVPTFDTLLEHASVWVDYQLKPWLQKFPWILPDSKTFCRRLMDLKLPRGKELWLVTGDVVAMYPNIPMEDGICQIARMLRSSAMEFHDLDEAATLKIKSRKELVILLLRLVLNFNYVRFSNMTFRQIIGTVMGTACAPTYANLFLAVLEVAPLAELKDIILFYARFIDDGFAIIQGTIEDVQRFQKRFGELHPNLRMEWTQSRYRLPFLDVEVSLEVAPGPLIHSPQYEIVTRVFQKALNAYLYIPWNSCHSNDSKRAWVKGELIQYIRISSRIEDFAKIRKEFGIRLHARGYPGRWLENVFEEVSYRMERPKALQPRENISEEDPVHVLKLTHNPLWDQVDFGPLWRELGDVWEEHGRGMPNLRFLASFAKPASLGDLLNVNNRDISQTYRDELAATV